MLLTMFRRFLAFLLTCLFVNTAPAQPLEPLLDQANADYAKQNYRAAAASYAQILELKTLPPSVSRDELIYRQADAEWRNLASTQQPDREALTPARRKLEKLAAALLESAKGARPPVLWAEAQESLGDSYWIPEMFRNWERAWEHYRRALDWWAGSTKLDTARQRYLDLVFRAAQSPGNPGRYPYGYGIGNWIPYEYLRNALEVAQTADEKAYANYLVALELSRHHGERSMDAEHYFRAALAAGKSTRWHDDALFRFARWALEKGGSFFNDYGNYQQRPDYEMALQLFRQLVDLYSKGESQWRDDAERQIESITNTDLDVSVSQLFLPDHSIRFNVRWRNLEEVAVALYEIDPQKDIQPSEESDPLQGIRNGESPINLTARSPVRRLTTAGNGQPYAPQQEELKIDEGLPAGTYVIQAEAGDKTAQDVLIVTGQTLTVLRDGGDITAWLTDALTGEPVQGAATKIWLGRNWYSSGKRNHEWSSATAETDADGLATFTADNFPKLRNRPLPDFPNLLAITASGKQNAFVSHRFYARGGADDPEWEVYAFTDRPAYRPEDTIHWKATARKRSGGETWQNTAGEKVFYRISGPRGDEVASGIVTLNEFGSTWSEVAAADDWALGMYRIEFREKSAKGDFIGGTDLFRLEEYKLPEFKVSVQTARADGDAATAYRLGDSVEIEVNADYTFGGAVTNAEVAVIVRKTPYSHNWRPPSPYPWFHRHHGFHRGYHGGGEIVIQENLKTDAEGRATFTLATDAGSRHDLEYTIEARVVDESRREVGGSANIRATRQPYFVYVHPDRTLYRPGEEASVTIKALNANDQPLKIEGRVRLTREEWREIWQGPNGETLSGKEYRERGGNGNGWMLIQRGYEAEERQTTTLTTNADGEAKFNFIVPTAGYYRVYWVSQPERSAPVKADAAVWVADDATLDIGYHGSLKIITDDNAFREGKPAPVMITDAQPGRWALVSVQAGDLLDTRVVKLEGNVKLLAYDVTSQWVPNVWLQANANYDLRAHADRKPVIVPPENHFIDVTVAPNAEHYRPRENGQVTITTKSTDGVPMAAEVALSVFDEAVLTIQNTLAPDPREFFYGEMRPDSVATSASTHGRPFAPPAALTQTGESRHRSGSGSERPIDPREYHLEVNEFGASQIRDFQPATRSAPMMRAAAMESGALMDVDSSGGAETANIVVRSDFRATAWWNPAITTDENGHASVAVEFPDSLTTWKLQAHAVGLPAKFGQGEASVQTRLPLIARLQTPRFVVTTDEVTLSGVITNNTGESINAQATLAIDGGLALKDAATQSITVPANGSARADWTIEAQTAGDARITLTATSPHHGDAMERTIPVIEHGIDQFLAQSGKMTTDQLEVTMDIPEFRTDGATFDLYLSPSIATTMLDALPYLAKYPYGCTEQTMSRFLPAVVVAHTLENLGLDANAAMNQTFGGIEASTPNKIIDAPSHPQPGDSDLNQLDDMVAAGLKRLADFQHHNGGWGWWKTGSTDPFMSAYVTWGLTLARDSGREIDANRLARAQNYLAEQLVEFEDQIDMQAWLLHALAADEELASNPKPDKYEARAFANLWKNRDQLNAYSRALTALSAHWLGFAEEAQILAENLGNGVVIDDDPQSTALNGTTQRNAAVLKTAHWGEDGIFWRWSNGGVEATAFTLMALVAITPDSELVEPAMNWLVKNRRGAQWSNTRDSAIVVLALNKWLQQSGELAASGEYTALLNGEAAGSITVTPETVLSAPRVISIPVAALKPGPTTVTLQRTAGDSPLYFSARFNFFSLEDPIQPAGNELFVERRYERVYPVKTLLDGFQSETEALDSGDSVQSGDRINVTMRIEAKNNLEYLLIEDLKPAGFEAVALQSGAPLYAREVRPDSLDDLDRYTGRQRWVYQELRDRQIACFIDRLPPGIWEITYVLRAETPGQFSALPVIGEAMYVPEIRGNSAEIEVSIEDKN